MNLIDEEVAKAITTPIREPEKKLPEVNVVKHKAALMDEKEIDAYLFKAGMKD